jgi:hypothetical protein
MKARMFVILTALALTVSAATITTAAVADLSVPVSDTQEVSITAPATADLPAEPQPTVATEPAPVPSATEEPTAAPEPAAEPQPLEATVTPSAPIVDLPTASEPAVDQPPTCEEDMPCWNCATMGNGVCGAAAGEALDSWLVRICQNPTFTDDAIMRHCHWQEASTLSALPYLGSTETALPCATLTVPSVKYPGIVHSYGACTN